MLFALAERVFGARAVDRRGEDVGDSLDEVRVVHRELARRAGMGAENAERPLLSLNHHAEPADDVVLTQERGAPEAAVGGQILHDDRCRGPEHVAAVGVAVRGQHGATDAPVVPPHARPQRQAAALGSKLEQPRVLHVEAAGH